MCYKSPGKRCIALNHAIKDYKTVEEKNVELKKELRGLHGLKEDDATALQFISREELEIRTAEMNANVKLKTSNDALAKRRREWEIVAIGGQQEVRAWQSEYAKRKLDKETEEANMLELSRSLEGELSKIERRKAMREKVEQKTGKDLISDERRKLEKKHIRELKQQRDELLGSVRKKRELLAQDEPKRLAYKEMTDWFDSRYGEQADDEYNAWFNDSNFDDPNDPALLEKRAEVQARYEQVKAERQAELAERKSLILKQDNIGKYLEAETRGSVRLPQRNEDVVEMFDYFSSHPKGRPLTGAERDIYNQAKERLASGEEFTELGKKARKNSFKAAQEDALTGRGARLPSTPSNPQADKEVNKIEKDTQEENLRRKREARTRAAQNRTSSSKVPPATKPSQSTIPTPPQMPQAPTRVVMPSPTTGKDLINTTGAERTTGNLVSATTGKPVTQTVQPSAPSRLINEGAENRSNQAPVVNRSASSRLREPAPVRPNLFRKLFTKK